ncbi:unnamed protein product [Spirodela intermedia]|uniref:Uncharacterized protein n=1 Tax=Spirodela intermedia TaxID=51605 RepID=A0A7I8L3M0_SPIIN|nr:unnamed protein product [Spirodela intermedia]
MACRWRPACRRRGRRRSCRGSPRPGPRCTWRQRRP